MVVGTDRRGAQGRRHDMNYDNVSKGLKDMPNASHACPSTQVTKVEKPPKPPKAPKTTIEPDAPAPC